MCGTRRPQKWLKLSGRRARHHRPTSRLQRFPRRLDNGLVVAAVSWRRDQTACIRSGLARLNQRIGPPITFIAVRETVGDPEYTHRDRPQSGDKRDEIHIVTANVSERIRILAREPVLKVRAPVIPFLEEEGGTEPEFSEEPFAIA